MKLSEAGVIAVIRLERPVPLAAARAIAAGGITAIELTLTTPGALDTITALQDSLPDCMIGAGTVLDAAQARSAVAAGARFCVGPAYAAAVHEVCRGQEVVYLPGAFTPTEILHAHQAGAELIKLFPARSLGAQYLRDLLAPLPSLRLIPSGGVGLADAASWIAAGAAAVSVGGSLIDDRNLDPATLTERARRLVATVQSAR